MTIAASNAWKALQEHARAIAGTHLRDLLTDERRCRAMTAEYDGILLDYARQNATTETMDLLFQLARAADLERKIQAMARGERINTSEDRAVLHIALRAPRGESILLDG